MLISSSSIWTPAFIATHTHIASAQSTLGTAKHCLLVANGTVTCAWAYTQHMGCDSDRTRWPHDRQNCSVRITSAELLAAVPQMSLSSELRLATSRSQNAEWRMEAFDVAQYDNGSVFSCVAARWTTMHELVFYGPVMGEWVH